MHGPVLHTILLDSTECAMRNEGCHVKLAKRNSSAGTRQVAGRPDI